MMRRPSLRRLRSSIASGSRLYHTGAPRSSRIVANPVVADWIVVRYQPGAGVPVRCTSRRGNPSGTQRNQWFSSVAPRRSWTHVRSSSSTGRSIVPEPTGTPLTRAVVDVNRSRSQVDRSVVALHHVVGAVGCVRRPREFIERQPFGEHAVGRSHHPEQVDHDVHGAAGEYAQLTGRRQVDRDHVRGRATGGEVDRRRERHRCVARIDVDPARLIGLRGDHVENGCGRLRFETQSGSRAKPPDRSGAELGGPAALARSRVGEPSTGQWPQLGGRPELWAGSVVAADVHDHVAGDR